MPLHGTHACSRSDLPEVGPRPPWGLRTDEEVAWFLIPHQTIVPAIPHFKPKVLSLYRQRAGAQGIRKRLYMLFLLWAWNQRCLAISWLSQMIHRFQTEKAGAYSKKQGVFFAKTCVSLHCAGVNNLRNLQLVWGERFYICSSVFFCHLVHKCNFFAWNCFSHSKAEHPKR